MSEQRVGCKWEQGAVCSVTFPVTDQAADVTL